MNILIFFIKRWKLILTIIGGIFYAPMWLQDKFDARWDAKAEPFKLQIVHIDEKLKSIDKKLDILIENRVRK